MGCLQLPEVRALVVVSPEAFLSRASWSPSLSGRAFAFVASVVTSLLYLRGSVRKR